MRIMQAHFWNGPSKHPRDIRDRCCPPETDACIISHNRVWIDRQLVRTNKTPIDLSSN